MSQYALFYLRTAPNTPYIYVGEFNRSSSIFQICCNLIPYERTTHLTVMDIETFIHKAEETILGNDATIQSLINKCNKLYCNPNFNDTIIAIIESYEESIKEEKEDREDNLRALNYFRFLKDILESNDDVIICAGIEAPAPDKENV